MDEEARKVQERHEALARLMDDAIPEDTDPWDVMDAVHHWQCTMLAAFIECGEDRETLVADIRDNAEWQIQFVRDWKVEGTH